VGAPDRPDGRRAVGGADPDEDDFDVVGVEDGDRLVRVRHGRDDLEARAAAQHGGQPFAVQADVCDHEHPNGLVEVALPDRTAHAIAPPSTVERATTR